MTKSAALLLLCLLSACGYRVLSAAKPFGAQRVAIVPFMETQPIGISPDMAAHLNRLLAASGMEITGNLAEADAQLTGRIHIFNAPSNSVNAVQIYTAGINLHAELKDRWGTRLWSGDFSLKEDFLPTDPTMDVQPLISETNRRTALRRLAEAAAQKIQSALVVDAAVDRAMQQQEPI